MMNFVVWNIRVVFLLFFSNNYILMMLVFTDEDILECNQIIFSVSMVAGWSAQCKILPITFLTRVHLDVIRAWKVYFLFMLLLIVFHEILFPFHD